MLIHLLVHNNNAYHLINNGLINYGDSYIDDKTKEVKQLTINDEKLDPNWLKIVASTDSLPSTHKLSWDNQVISSVRNSSEKVWPVNIETEVIWGKCQPIKKYFNKTDIMRNSDEVLKVTNNCINITNIIKH